MSPTILNGSLLKEVIFLMVLQVNLLVKRKLQEGRKQPQAMMALLLRRAIVG
jgi:hypothetical protein